MRVPLGALAGMVWLPDTVQELHEVSRFWKQGWRVWGLCRGKGATGMHWVMVRAPKACTWHGQGWPPHPSVAHTCAHSRPSSLPALPLMPQVLSSDTGPLGCRLCRVLLEARDIAVKDLKAKTWDPCINIVESMLGSDLASRYLSWLRGE